MSYYHVLAIDMTIFGARRRSRDGSPNLQSYISAVRCQNARFRNNCCLAYPLASCRRLTRGSFRATLPDWSVLDSGHGKGRSG